MAASPVASYAAPPDVIVRFVQALREWDSDYTVTVDADSVGSAPMPCWQLWIWD
ncbi:hypothetical protein ACFQZZ_26275 [Nocardia sp. GCM10030253]|uniref:hypothetical protein n=1 Tax=Nocardia sp. GCM10030253 TaxID=3273404 RepID=UPI003626C8A4